MSDQHTSEPWESKSTDGSNHERCTIYSSVGGRGIARHVLPGDARRIVVCVNACAGVPTYLLEGDRLAVHRDNVDLRKKLDDLESSADVDELYELRRECDEFLTMLTSAVEALKNIENDDGSIPDTIWAMRNAALTAAAASTAGKRRF